MLKYITLRKIFLELKAEPRVVLYASQSNEEKIQTNTNIKNNTIKCYSDSHQQYYNQEIPTY